MDNHDKDDRQTTVLTKEEKDDFDGVTIEISLGDSDEEVDAKNEYSYDTKEEKPFMRYMEIEDDEVVFSWEPKNWFQKIAVLVFLGGIIATIVIIGGMLLTIMVPLIALVIIIIAFKKMRKRFCKQ